MAMHTMEDFQSKLDDLIALVQDLVHRESPSTNKPALDALGAYVGEQMQSLGAEVERFPQEKHGDHWLGSWGQKGSGGVLLLVHLDTVYPIGTLEKTPWRRDTTHFYGPGALDMKVSLAMALIVIDQLKKDGNLRPDIISLLCTSDEETGSYSSRYIIEQQAREHELVLCLEPALPDGSLKTWRKGILNFKIEAHGHAAHAGSEIEAGTNAIVEIMHQIDPLINLRDEEAETTVNIGVIQGGSRSNVVPDHCSLKVDIRAKTKAEGDRVLAAIKRLSPVQPNATLTVKGGWNRPPMERDSLMQATFQRAANIASSLGISLSEGGTGGGSDANFVHPLGVPVLDGLGAIGTGAHSERECVEINSLPERCALLAGLITGW